MLLKEMAKKLRRRWRNYKNRPRLSYPHKDNFVGSLEIGESTLMGKAYIDCTGTVEIGSNCIISDGARIISHTHDFMKGVVEDITRVDGVVPTRVKICDNVYIGGEATIMPQVDLIGESAVIGARAVLTRNVGPYEIWAGNPARMIGSRRDQAASHAEGNTSDPS